MAGLRRLLRFGGVTALATVALLCPTDVGRRAAAAADACALVTFDEAMTVVGGGTDDMSGPLVVRDGTCSWAAAESTCTMRILSVAVDRSAGAGARFVASRAGATTWTGAPGIGDDAYYTADELPEGAAVFIQHLALRRGDTVATVTLVGRIGADSAHELLGRVGASVADRL